MKTGKKKTVASVFSEHNNTYIVFATRIIFKALFMAF